MAQANAAIQVSDREGRLLTLRRMGALDRLRRFKAKIEALISRLGDSGIAAVADGLRPEIEQNADGEDLPGN